MNLTELFFNFSQMGHEVTLWILVLLSLLSVAFIIERFVKLSKALQQSHQSLAKLSQALEKKDFVLESFVPSAQHSLLNEGLRYWRTHGEAGFEEFFNTRLRLLRPELESFLTYLATVGSNAPFIGLLGTVFGVMDAFRGLVSSQGTAVAGTAGAGAAAASSAEAVMLGISQALVATAVGLMVAIPAVIAYNYFQKRVRLILQNFESVRDLCIGAIKNKRKGKL